MLTAHHAWPAHHPSLPLHPPPKRRKVHDQKNPTIIMNLTLHEDIKDVIK